MTKVEKYIQDYTRGCSNEMAAIKYADGRTETYYHEWLTPENAFSVAEIAKEEVTERLWKDAQGDDLPEIDREVIALLDNGKVVFAHRPNPEGWDAKSIITEKVERYIPETYDKGGWNIPDVKWWLDCSMPKVEED